ncbi:MAG TPA: beta-L-arabinofuranosidase domain-containing protein, partial [Actinomycetes bacterium]|nr:beta-L-arabinofuranosidase domain-containing protein [Actinomycetes bacterium]
MPGPARVTILDGLMAERQRVNRQRTIPHGFDQLERSGTLDNLRLAAGADGRYRALADTSGATFPFLDSDVYKWLEAVGWELGRAADPGLAAAADQAIGLVAAAQRPDGYLNSYVQVVGDGTPHRDLAWGHELYCVGHLIQAAVAWHRELGDDRLLEVAIRAADRIDKELGPGGRDGVDGHPGIEMALVELTRVTGDPRYLALAARMLDLRGKGLLGPGRFGAAYWQDHQPVREAATVAGHAVRQLYLDCGAVDVAVELEDQVLLDAVRRRWQDLVATRTYLTGGMGSRHRDESFGDPFELPPDRAYAETCAAIASVMLGWRLLLATGEAGYADAIERALYNGVLSGVSLDGTRFFYVNPLQRRTRRAWEPPGDGGRAPWYPCACCPPNLMRLLSSWERYVADADAGGVRLHQHATADVRAEVAGGPVRLSVRTGYPWEGRIAVEITETPER